MDKKYILSIDPFNSEDSSSPVNDKTKAIFDHNVKLSKYPDKSRLIQDYSHFALKGLLDNDCKFNYITIDGSHLSKEVLLDAKLCFELLEEGGILFFDDYLGGDDSRETNVSYPKIGIDLFLNGYKNNYTILYSGYHLVIQKKSKPVNDIKIFDCFPFFNELDMLKLRLEELKNVVDTFVLVESKYTFNGETKPLYFDLNKDKFTEYNIVHLVIDNTPDTNAWNNEAFQRNFAQSYLLEHITENDVVSLCDLDEIPDPELLRIIKSNGCFVPGYLEMDFYYYNTDWLKKTKWTRASLVSQKELDIWRLEDIRNGKAFIFPIENSGWHFSYFMSPELISQKIKSFSHQEFNKEEFLTIGHIKHCIDQGIDLFNRGENENLVRRTFQKLPKKINILNKTSTSYAS